MKAEYLSAPAVAARLATKLDRVYAFIRNGELKATNIGSNRNGRPTWRIDPDDLDAFLAARTPHPKPKPASRRRKQSTNIIEFF